MCRVYTFLIERDASFDRFVADVANADKGEFFPVAYFTAFANLDSVKRSSPIGHNALSTGISNNERTHAFLLSRVHQIAPFWRVHRGGDRQVGDTPHIRQVIGAVMCRAIGTGYSGTIQANHHMEILNGYIVYHLIVCTLHET